MYTFERLKAWQRAMDLAQATRELASSLPPEERFCLGDQLRRCGSAVALNIAEGAGSESKREFMRYCRIALREIYEVVTAVKIGQPLRYWDADRTGGILLICDDCGALTRGLINRLAKQAAPASRHQSQPP